MSKVKKHVRKTSTGRVLVEEHERKTTKKPVPKAGYVPKTFRENLAVLQEVERISETIEGLAEAVDNLKNTEQYEKWLKSLSSFHKYSFINSLLITMQKPEATLPAGKKAWEAMNRTVKKDEQGIQIIFPFMKNGFRTETDESTGEEVKKKFKYVSGWGVASVYDISQTEGDPLPELESKPLKGEAPEGSWEGIAQFIEDKGYTLETTELPPGVKGQTRLNNDQTVTIVLSPEVQGIEKVAVAVHEVAHAEMHFDINRSQVTTEQKEAEAEAVAYVIVESLGYENESSIPYIAGWNNSDTDQVAESAKKIQETAKDIMKYMPLPERVEYVEKGKVKAKKIGYEKRKAKKKRK